MKFGRGQDLIIGMTLAEVFLLALLVGWLGTRDEITTTKVGLTEALRKIEELTASLLQVSRESDEWRKRYEELLRAFEKAGGFDPRTGDFVPFGEKPKCDPQDNVLVSVEVKDGRRTVRFKRQYAEYQRGDVVEEGEIDVFLGRIRRESDSTSIIKDRIGCRYQYDLSWLTDTDYREAREIFEGAFYAGRFSRLPGDQEL